MILSLMSPSISTISSFAFSKKWLETGFFMFQYEFPELKRLPSITEVQKIRIRWQDKMRQELRCNLSDITISIY